jgi:hypothetical protein
LTATRENVALNDCFVVRSRSAFPEIVMQLRPFVVAVGLGSIIAACSSDSNNGSSPAGASPEAGTGGAHSGGAPSTGGGTSLSGGSGSGGSNSGGMGTSSAGNKGSGGIPTGGGGGGHAGVTIDGGAGTASSGGAETGGSDAGGSKGPIEHVFLIAMENHDLSEVIGDMTDAPYINGTLIKNYASTSNFNDLLDISIPSEPHYVLVEAGTNMFSDVTFTGDGEPAAGNSTMSSAHLATQMQTAQVSWMSYQQGIDATSGDCPIHASGYYMPKHDPFVFFQDVSGSPPSTTNAYCAEHHKELGKLDDDLKNDQVASYNFITPDQCHDMHGQAGCPDSNTIRAGDGWLKAQLTTLLPYANTHHGVIFVFWDEGTATLKVPFLAVGPNVKKNYVGSINYNHRSITKTIEKIFGLPYLDTVKGDNDFSDLFEGGTLP